MFRVLQIYFLQCLFFYVNPAFEVCMYMFVCYIRTDMRDEAVEFYANSIAK